MEFWHILALNFGISWHWTLAYLGMEFWHILELDYILQVSNLQLLTNILLKKNHFQESPRSPR
jgi:hypothetical protein